MSRWTIDGPLEPPCPPPVPLVVDRVEDLVALGVGQLHRDELPGEVEALRGRGRRRRFLLNRLRGFDLSGIGLHAARISGMGGERSMDAVIDRTCSMLNACAAGDCATATGSFGARLLQLRITSCSPAWNDSGVICNRHRSHSATAASILHSSCNR